MITITGSTSLESKQFVCRRNLGTAHWVAVPLTVHWADVPLTVHWADVPLTVPVAGVKVQGVAVAAGALVVGLSSDAGREASAQTVLVRVRFLTDNLTL